MGKRKQGRWKLTWNGIMTEDRGSTGLMEKWRKGTEKGNSDLV